MSCKAKPADEKVVKVNAHLVTYEDPPHVKGDGVRSGGLNADNGAMTYYAAPNASFQGDCTLPASDKSLCTTVLNQFIRWFGSV